MLSSTADHLFWMARYTERAENTARMLDIHLQSSLLAGGKSSEERSQAARAMLLISELEPAYLITHDVMSSDSVLRFMVADSTNASSIYNALYSARENARAVRGALTTELWETMNVTWLELQERLTNDAWARDMPAFFAWVKHRAHLTRGVTSGTMPRDDAYRFVALGTALERADNVARLLDVKFFEGSVNSEQDWDARVEKDEYYHWAAILRSVSGFEIYRKTYRDTITPARVAELLILRADMPRSLMAAMNALCNQLVRLANKRSAQTLRQAGLLQAQIQYAHIDDVLQQGLHAYLTQFLERINAIGQGISQDFLVA
ncbi:MAG: alpha-E domain-containing protein [Cytophagales bacterium]|nr:alpha-E domain-containing protein [Cytophagales bacterium]